ncbi:MAG: EutN/CcmL family microcompartment protein [bacterium]
MKIAKVVGSAVSTLKHEAYMAKKLLIVQPLDLEGNPLGNSTLAVDYVGAGEGDYVLVGSAPGVAQQVFSIEIAPIRELVMGVIDHVEVGGRIVMDAEEDL